jgi:hypothetical protein
LQRITEGPLFVNLVNGVFRFDAERQRHEENRRNSPQLPHWDNTEAAARARELTAILQTGHGLFDEIATLEADALLVLVGEAADAADLSAWHERFIAFKQRVFDAVRPDSATCTIGLYGSASVTDLLFSAFSGRATAAGFTAKVRVVRMAEEAKKAPTSRAAGGPGQDQPAREPAAQAGAYLKWPWPEAPSALKKGLVVGYEVELRGAAVFDYFRKEAGVWRIWEGDRKSDAWVAVRNSTLAEFQTPHGVHRQHFFDGLAAHRQLKASQLSDPQADWRCDFPDESAWRRLLDRHFEALMDRMLLGQED